MGIFNKLLRVKQDKTQKDNNLVKSLDNNKLITINNNIRNPIGINGTILG